MDIQMINIHPQTRVVTIGLKPKKVTGIYKLIQIVVLSLMNVPGRDVLDPDAGGGLPELLNINISPNDSTELFAEAATMIKKTEREIIDFQADIDDPPEEKLSALQIAGIDSKTNSDSIYVRIRVINQANQASEVVV